MWLPPTSILQSMGYTSSSTNTWNISTMLQSLGTNYNVVYYNIDGTSTGWKVFIRGDWAGSDLKYISNANDKPYWINMSSEDRLEI
jgi:hypothetical protein